MHFLKRISAPIIGILSILLLILSTSIFFIPILIIGILKLIPNLHWRILCVKTIDNIIQGWVAVNNFYVNYFRRTKIYLDGEQNLNKKNWYLIIANHQSWLDIVLLQYIFNRKIPMLKFFIKDGLKWIPLLGFAWWAMGSPFMKRYSKEYLLQNPHKKGKDLQTTRKALKIFQHTPSTIMNFIEGTRFTVEKHGAQQSPYQHLLKPKAGGISFVMNVLGKQITHILDVTIIYPHKPHSLWDYLCGRIEKVIINIREITIPDIFQKADMTEANHAQFCNWLNQQWLDKDRLIAQLRTHYMIDHGSR